MPYMTGSCPGRGRQQEDADVYQPRPAPSAATPVVVLVHGGSFFKGDRELIRYRIISAALARLGWTAGTVDYCLPPFGTAGFGVEQADADRTVRWVGANAVRLRVNRGRLAVWGGSAGATLAVGAAEHLDRARHHPVRAAVGWSGIYDMRGAAGLAVQRRVPLSNYLGCTLTTVSCGPREKQASDVLHVPPAMAPVYLANSTREEMPLTQLTLMSAALAARHVRVRTQVVPGPLHSVDYTDAGFCSVVHFLIRLGIGAIRVACTPPRMPVDPHHPQRHHDAGAAQTPSSTA